MRSEPPGTRQAARPRTVTGGPGTPSSFVRCPLLPLLSLQKHWLCSTRHVAKPVCASVSSVKREPRSPGQCSARMCEGAGGGGWLPFSWEPQFSLLSKPGSKLHLSGLAQVTARPLYGP